MTTPAKTWILHPNLGTNSDSHNKNSDNNQYSVKKFDSSTKRYYLFKNLAVPGSLLAYNPLQTQAASWLAFPAMNLMTAALVWECIFATKHFRTINFCHSYIFNFVLINQCRRLFQQLFFIIKTKRANIYVRLLY